MNMDKYHENLNKIKKIKKFSKDQTDREVCLELLLEYSEKYSNLMESLRVDEYFKTEKIPDSI